MKSLENVILLYISFVLLLYFFKPLHLFNSKGKLKSFGVGYTRENEKKTLLHIHIVLLLSIFIFSHFYN
jgi:hypothetical protein